MIGRTLGHYRIDATLGQGGMGVVYRATDTHLDRPVAIKVLPADAVANPERKKRFVQEARAASALNHPNIVHIYDIDRVDGVDFIAMEFVAGDTLSERIGPQGLPPKEALTLAIQIADALARAHAAGIVHRDLKPANVMVTADGLVKLLDFGLAKLTEQSESDPAATTRTAEPRTEEGAIVGTAPYMSPEQVQGKKLDARSDIFSFGAVLYEMLTGQRAFRGPDRISTLAAILREEPQPVRELSPGLPGELERLLARCLRKDVARRWQTMADLKVALEDVREEPAAAASLAGAQPLAPLPRRTPRTRLAWGIAGAAASLAILIAAGIFWRRPANTAAPVRFLLSLPESVDNWDLNFLRLPFPSPDGRRVVYAARDEAGQSYLWIRELDSLSGVKLAGTEDARWPFWSGDGRWIGFTAQGKLKKVSPSGGPAQTLADLPGFAQMAWNQQGDILFSPSNRTPLFRLRESGGPPVPVTSLDTSRGENSHRWPVFLPDGRRFLYVARCSARENNALYLGSLDSLERKLLIPSQANGAYVPPHGEREESLLFFREGSLFLQPFRAASATLHGEPVPVADAVTYDAASALASFAPAAHAPVLLYREGASPGSQLTWYDRQGKPLGALGSAATYIEPRISADGRRVLVSRPDDRTGNRDIWQLEVQRGVASRLTVDAANDWHPVWSPDGTRLLFGSDRSRDPEVVLFLKRTLDPGRDEEALPGNIKGLPTDWSPNGRWLLFGRSRGQNYDIWAAQTAGDGQPFPFLASAFNEHSPRFSPDSRWVAYVSNESGRYEVYVRPFEGQAASPEGKRRISIAGGDFPAWSRDGNELFYIAGDLSLAAVPVRGLDRLDAPLTSSTLFRPCSEHGLVGSVFSASPWEHPYDVAPDGRFLFNCRAGAPSPTVVAVNWAAALKR